MGHRQGSQLKAAPACAVAPAILSADTTIGLPKTALSDFNLANDTTHSQSLSERNHRFETYSVPLLLLHVIHDPRFISSKCNNLCSVTSRKLCL